MVSILMCNYNGSEYLELAIQSMLWQDFKDFEFIIIDDGSTDNSRDIITKYAHLDNRIVSICNLWRKN